MKLRIVRIMVLLGVVASVACAQSFTLDDLDVVRYTVASSTKYQWQQGSLSQSGYIPSTSSYLDYGTSNMDYFPTYAQIAPVSGKILVQLSLWNSLKVMYVNNGYPLAMSKFRISSETYLIQDVPYVEVKFVGSGTSLLPPLQSTIVVSQALGVSWVSEVGKTYLIERSSDMENWTSDEETTAGTGGVLTRFVLFNGAKIFVRVKEIPDGPPPSM